MLKTVRFFADHCVSNYIMRALCYRDYEVFRLKDHIPPDSPDTLVISKAQKLGAILLSLNGDFADIVTYPPSDYICFFIRHVSDHIFNGC